jgi:hypothetical protein
VTQQLAALPAHKPQHHKTRKLYENKQTKEKRRSSAM